MSQINIKYDNQLTFEEIRVPLTAPTQDEVGDNNTGVMTAEAQTKIIGVCTPLIAIDSIVFSIENILEMKLYNTDALPSFYAVLNDPDHMLNNLSKPNRDNVMRLQLLPPFENAYKKINLNFFIDDIDIDGNRVTVSGKYKVPDLYNSRFVSFGKLNTYELFDKIASDCKLGFATNCESNDVDKRFIYASNMSYNSLMNKQIKQSGDSQLVYDYWIDLWNNINLSNIYERYNTQDADEDMQIWVQKGIDTQVDNDTEVETIQQLAMITNNPMDTSPIKASSYKILTNTGKATLKGTDQVYMVYKDGEVLDYLVQDGNVKKDVFVKYEYLGENIGDFNYLFAKSVRNSFLDIVDCNKIEVTIDFPSLALMRGHQCKLLWYENDFTSKVNQELMNDVETNIELEPQGEELDNPDAYVINKQISGQYLITGMVLEYDTCKWKQKLTLVRPQDKQNKVFENE